METEIYQAEAFTKTSKHETLRGNSIKTFGMCVLRNTKHCGQKFKKIQIYLEIYDTHGLENSTMLICNSPQN